MSACVYMLRNATVPDYLLPHFHGDDLNNFEDAPE